MSAKMIRAGVASLLVIAAAACNFDVTNPGPTDDKYLDRPEAHQAIANGAAYYVSQALAELSYTTSAVTRELFPSGSTSSFGISIKQQQGRLEYDDEHESAPFQYSLRAIYIGESGFDRMAETHAGGNNGYKPAVEAALYAAYAERILGENFCESAINGSAIITREAQLKRAETWFTTTINTAGSVSSFSTQKTAAYAGRAAVRVQLGDWTGALADAAQVPTSFTFYAKYDASQQSYYNRIYFAGAAQPYKAVTAWNTKYVDYYTQTLDPRVPWVDRKTVGDAAVLLVGNKKVPFYEQQKYPNRDSGIMLSSGREMRLIEAESKLKGGDIAGAFKIINDRRAELKPAQPALSPANLTEAWTMLKSERGIELWLEGRRLGDLYRWKYTNTPGALDPYETAGNAKSYLDADQTLVYPIPQNEREANKNIPITPAQPWCAKH